MDDVQCVEWARWLRIFVFDIRILDTKINISIDIDILTGA